MRKKSFEAQIVDWADEVTYAIHDLEDWYRAGFIPLALVRSSQEERERCAAAIKQLWRVKRIDPDATYAELSKKVAGRPLKAGDVDAALNRLFGGHGESGPLGLVDGEFDGSRAALKRVHHVRQHLFGRFVNDLEDWVAVDDAPRVRHQNDLRVPDEVVIDNEVIRAMMRVYVTGSRRLISQQLGQRRILAELWETHWSAVTRWLKSSRTSDLGVFPLHMQDWLADVERSGGKPAPSVEAGLIRLVADHISGLSDQSATDLHGRLTGSSQGAVNALMQV